MTKAKTRRTRRKRRGEKGRRRGPNRPSKHKSPTGRTGSAHRKKSQSKKPVHFIISIPHSLMHLMHFSVRK